MSHPDVPWAEVKEDLVARGLLHPIFTKPLKLSRTAPSRLLNKA